MGGIHPGNCVVATIGCGDGNVHETLTETVDHNYPAFSNSRGSYQYQVGYISLRDVSTCSQTVMFSATAGNPHGPDSCTAVEQQWVGGVTLCPVDHTTVGDLYERLHGPRCTHPTARGSHPTQTVPGYQQCWAAKRKAGTSQGCRHRAKPEAAEITGRQV